MTTAIAYWDDVAAAARFTHPLNEAWIDAHCDKSGRVLDYGCGYGRLLARLSDHGFNWLYGVDPSPEMIRRARVEVPEAEFQTMERIAAAHPSGSISLVLLVAVLTCVPDPAEHGAIIAEIDRLLEPRGTLYVSDFPLQSDARNVNRYRRFADRGFEYGSFEIDDGRAVMRHLRRSYFDDLFGDFELLEDEEFNLKTMKGNPAVGKRMLLRKA